MMLGSATQEMSACQKVVMLELAGCCVIGNCCVSLGIQIIASYLVHGGLYDYFYDTYSCHSDEENQAERPLYTACISSLSRGTTNCVDLILNLE